MQNVQNRAARLIKGIRRRERITPVLIDLHWLPIKARIEYKICLLAFKAIKNGEPVYLREKLCPFQLASHVVIRHASDEHRLFEARAYHKIGERVFKYCASRLYNKLPA